jgi:hypothetical protein
VQGKAIVNSISLKEGEDAFRHHANLIRRYGAAAVEAACARALEWDVVSVGKIASMLERATEQQVLPASAASAAPATARFARDPAEFTGTGHSAQPTAQLTLLPAAEAPGEVSG